MSGRPLRNLTARPRTTAAPGFTVCTRCGAVADNQACYTMLRPGRSRGVVWCPTCAAPYLEVDTVTDPNLTPETDQPTEDTGTDTPAVTEPGVAAPGPHPLESDDTRFWRGDTEELPEGAEPTAGEQVGDAPTDPNQAAPGPHPHESGDVEDWGGRSTALPKGVEPTPAPTSSEDTPET